MAILSSSSGNAATLGNLIVWGEVPKSAAAARGMGIKALVSGQESAISMEVAAQTSLKPMAQMLHLRLGLFSGGRKE